MAYTDITNVRLLSNITTNDVSDADVTSLITSATAQLNSDINTKVVRERISYIDDTRQNTQDSSNTSFYVKNWKEKYIADMNDDGGITKADIIVYQVASDGTETTPTISSVDSVNGKFVLSSAPSSDVELYVTYEYCLIDPDTPSPKIKLACTLLTLAYCYEKINRGMSPQQVYGNVRFMRDMKAGNEYFKRYETEIAKINGEMGSWEEADVF